MTHPIQDPTPAAYGRFANAPASNTDVLRCDGVSGPSEAAADALESRLRRTIARVDQSAGWTGPRGVVRVDVDHPHSRQRRFVGDELAQLVERPGVQDAPLRPPSLDPRANTFEILEGKSSLRALGRAHQALTDGVVVWLMLVAKRQAVALIWFAAPLAVTADR